MFTRLAVAATILPWLAPDDLRPVGGARHAGGVGGAPMVTIVDEEQQHALALGATGYLTKPIQRAELLQLLAPWRTPMRPTRVLVIEDDADQRAAISTALREPNWEVIEATSVPSGSRRTESAG